MIWRIRVLFFYLMAALLTAIHIPPLMLLSLCKVEYSTKYILARTYNHSFVYLVKIICGLNYTIEGEENIPTKGPVVILANHQSFWDNVIMPVLFPIQSWVIKKQLLDIPVFGLGLKLMEPIALDRTNAMSVRKILQIGSQKLENGISVVIFPESTRLNPGQNAPFKAGCATLAFQNNVPIIPMAHNAGTLWPKGFWIHPGTIKVKIGKPMMAKEGQDARALSADVEKWIVETKNSL
jgi:1-acyl-sn-glycerol-3-phosphate acyltransferase